jgi:hypothetical protein
MGSNGRRNKQDIEDSGRDASKHDELISLDDTGTLERSVGSA